MNDRFREIEEFLRIYAEYYRINPTEEISRATIYAGLMNHGLSNDDIGASLKGNFDDWIRYFSNKRNLEVFWSDMQPAFLQFQNNSTPKKINDAVKMYVPFNKAHMNECVKILFDFIEKNNIPTASKVADIMRDDAVVLRIYDIEAAKLIEEFIINNDYLRSNMISVNPFLINSKGIGYAADDYISYNTTLAIIISEYMKEKRNNNDFNSVSLNDFRSFVIRFYNSKIVGNEINDFLSLPDVQATFRNRFHNDIVATMTNYYQVVRLIIDSLDQNKGLDEYFNHVKKCNDTVTKNKIKEFYKNKVEEIKKQDSVNITGPIKTNANDEFYKNIFDLYINTAVKKYGIRDTIIYIQRFMDGSKNAITRENGCREQFDKYMNSEIILRITNNNIREYIIKKVGDPRMQLFYTAVEATFKKHGLFQVKGAIRLAIENGKYDCFTNNGTEKIRENLEAIIMPNEIIEIMQKTILLFGGEIDNNMDLVDQYLNVIGILNVPNFGTM